MGGGKTNRPDSYTGDAIGDSSAVMLKIPSNGRSGNGLLSDAEMRASTLYRSVCWRRAEVEMGAGV
jgi:hypothetical protein